MLVNTRLEANEKQNSVTFSEAILNPSAKHGGLYAPDILPNLDANFFAWAKDKSYKQIALKIIEKFNFDVEISIFEKALERYDDFDDGEPIKIIEFAPNIYINELWHGPTRAFKDMALQPFGALINALAQKNSQKYLIICATSGDTGPATLETFSGSQFVRVVCLYPYGATSATQRLQMINVSAPNLRTIGIRGNFDDAQKALKSLLADSEFKSELKTKNIELSAANSVNFGRILFQIIYHVYVCVKIAKPLNIIVPSGNFGDALGAYYAKKMGANIVKIGIASNSNNILTDFVNSGIYDLRERKLIATMSPAMDILVSSNVERLLFDLFGAQRTNELMKNLKECGFYELSANEKAQIKETFYADFCNDDECAIAIKNAANKGKLIDPHTATCFKMLKNDAINVITSTAQWVKFTPSMVKAIKARHCIDELDEMRDLASEFSERIPPKIEKLFSLPSTQNSVVEISEIKYEILKALL